MATRKPKTILYRRKREGKTNYAKRLKLLMSRKNRLVVRFSNKKINAQLIGFETKGDKILAAIDSSALKKLGWNHSCKNIPAAYLTGLLIGKKSLEKDQKEAILDLGDKVPLHKGKIFAFLKGVLDSGMSIPHKEGIFPEEEKLKGKNAEDFEKIKQKIKTKVFNLASQQEIMG